MDVFEPIKMFIKKFRLFAIIIFILFGHLTSTFADDTNKKVGVGLGYSYMSLKYGLSNKISLEGRYTFDIGINLYGGRLYYNFNPQGKGVIYTGIQFDYIDFYIDDISGTGFGGLAFLGLEYFLSKTLTLAIELGPTYTKLADATYSNVNKESIDWVINTGINIYLGAK